MWYVLTFVAALQFDNYACALAKTLISRLGVLLRCVPYGTCCPLVLSHTSTKKDDIYACVFAEKTKSAIIPYHEDVVLSNELMKIELQQLKIWKAEVLSVSPSS